MPVNALATRVLLSCRQAVLASQSASVPGFPVTSVIPISIKPNGQIIALMSETALHTKNITLDSRMSMLFHDDLEENWQDATRLSVLGKMRPMLATYHELVQVRLSFNLLHPTYKDFDRREDFHFWELEPVRFRLLTGGEHVHWLDRIAPDFFELGLEDRLVLNDLLFKHGLNCAVVQVSRYGIQIVEQNKVRFLSLKEPVAQVAELIEQINANQFDDPASVD